MVSILRLTEFYVLYRTALVGVNLKEVLDKSGDGMQGTVLDFKDRLGDRIQVFLE